MLPPRLAQNDRFGIAFVCAGNICRSPMAEAIFQHQVSTAGLQDHVAVRSAGIGDWHVGEPPDHRTLEALTRHGYPLLGRRAQQFDPAWFPDLDLVVALDSSHERALRDWAPSESDRSKVATLLSFDPAQAASRDVPDPYYRDDAAFEQVLGMIEEASAQLFRQIRPAIT
ncbi:low molecular weight protein-tyrosine-phosphatase [Mycetocola reblochoni]|uniref:protein-tyrosine-phosphatase n=2 Tax=Mycetocola reblochoni TaxID=331618 RepID=A0A1R4JLU5_9MICO|nr:low molecular weight protein-tyrosine-phosphatase [Mycetocola reblochoni]SJN33231.1 Low molecular weight protein tyrosine phosphatase [Mycetocola reblochoni REB411]